MHACDIASGGIVWCWGLNGDQGRIGSNVLGAGSYSATPVRVPDTGPGALRFVQLSSYGASTCGIATDSRAYCWGYNGWSQLGIPSGTPSSHVPVAVSGGHTFKEVSVGADHACAVTPDGRAFCWGHNDWRQFAANAPGSSATPVAVMPAERFQSITAGSSFTCGISIAGKTYCWGSSGIGQLGDGSPISYGNTFSANPLTVAGVPLFRRIDAGLHYTCAVTHQGQAFCWGSNGGRLGNGTTAATSTPTPVSGGISFKSVAAGNAHTCGVDIQAALWCWGSNGNGRLGTTLPNASTVPVRSAGALTFSEVGVAGVTTGHGAHTCAISEDRLTVYCFGRNDAGQLGNGSTTSDAAVNSTPVIVAGQKPLM
jgi:alpha-tubulin suppressor-like RCC1 family protein